MTHRLPLAMPAALCAGLVAGGRGWMAGSAGGVVLAALALLAAVVGLAAVRRARPGAATLLMLVASLLGGWTWGAARVQATAPEPVTRAGAVEGLVAVTGFPTRGARGVRVPVQVERLSGPRAPRPGTRLILDLPHGARTPPIGAVVRLSGSVGPAAGATAPSWWHAWLARQRIARRLRTSRWVAADWRDGVAGARDALRRWAHANAAAGLSGDRAAMVSGMALGGGEGLSPRAKTAMRDSGLWHLLAVSGQNVAVIGIGVVAVLGAAGAPRRGRTAVAGLAMLAYCLACDGGASVMRAGLMGAIGVAADLRGGRRAPWNALVLSLAVMLALDPLSIGDPGLQLSFAAVAGLFAVAPPLAQWLRGVLPGRVADLAAQSAGAGLATAPVLALGFGSLPVAGLVANLVAVPIAGPVVVLAMVGAVGHWVWAPLGVVLSWAAAAGASVILGVAAIAAALPGAVQRVPAWGAVPLALLAAAPPAAWWWLRRLPPPSAGAHRRPWRPWVRRGLAAAGAAAIAVLLPGALPGCGGAQPADGPAVRMLDVGQGAAIALRDGRRVPVLFDAGPPGQPTPVVDALDRMGADSVGALVISHAARDHLGGAIAVMDRLPLRAVVLPQADRFDPALMAVARHARARDVDVQWAMRGTQVDAGPWRVRVIGPTPAMERAGDANLRSLVLGVTAPGISAVLPADAESPALAGVDLPRSDVLQVGHHGSADPGLHGVLERVRPGVTLVSAGRGNPYGHPRPSVLGAIAASGAAALRTDRGGDIDVRPGPSGIVVSRG